MWGAVGIILTLLVADALYTYNRRGRIRRVPLLREQAGSSPDRAAN
ncbi:hypothetical protein [Haladaptatus halobius]|nr:hypothetical protein [Haladaptatus halobius]